TPSRHGSWCGEGRSAQGVAARSRPFSSSALPCAACSCPERRFPMTCSATSGTAACKPPALIHICTCRTTRRSLACATARFILSITAPYDPPTMYPPTAQVVFYLVTRISEAPIAMKAAMVAFEGLAVWTMLQLLALRGLPRSRILLYAWHPLPLWEFARSG